MIRQDWSTLKKLMFMKAAAGGGSAAVERIALGNPLTFGTDLARPLVSLEIPFTPKQTGTGDPSPSNIRPILPWNGLTVFGGGKNLFNSDRTRGTPSNTDQSASTKRTFDESKFVTGLSSQNDYNTNRISSYDLTNGVLTFTATRSTYGIGFPVSLVAGSYTLKSIFNGRLITVATYDFDGTYTGRVNLNSTGVFSIENNCMAVIIFFGEENTEAQAKEIQLEVGSSATAYEPYKPITDTDIVFPSPVYGGTLDVVSGVLTVEWAGFSATWGDGESATDMGSGITRKVYPMVDYLTTGLANNMCNIAPYQASESANVHFYYSGSGSTNRKCRLFLPSDTPDTTAVTVVTKLSQTYEVQLTPAQITALVGDNTIWSDADGSMTCVYLVSSKYAEDHPVGGLSSGLGSGLLGSNPDPDEPIEDPEVNPEE